MDHLTLFRTLNEAGVRYVVDGRVALCLHGIPRMTYDIDLVADLEEENAAGLFGLLAARGYRAAGVPDPGEAARPGGRERLVARGMKVLRFVNAAFEAGEVDVALVLPDSWEALAGRAAEVKAAGVAVPVMATADLAAVKRDMGRPDDEVDLEALAILERIVAGEAEALSTADLRYDQIRKFRHWEPERRLEWLVSGAQLRRSSHGGGGRGTAKGKAALRRGRIRGIDHFQDLT